MFTYVIDFLFSPPNKQQTKQCYKLKKFHYSKVMISEHAESYKIFFYYVFCN